ncbi:MAG: hypothetical protein ACI8TQ_003751 [Planctomycetota bacterium]|jgi:hypothetical protein
MNRLIALLLPLLFLVSCGGGGSGHADESSKGFGSISIEATDAPFDFAILKSAVVTIDKIRVHGSSVAETGFMDLGLENEIKLNLVNLRNGVTEFMLNDMLPIGEYRQLRLRVSGGRIELTNGKVFSSVDGSLKLKSQAKSGFKVFIDPPIKIDAGEVTNVLLDFDLSKTFKAVPANDPENANFFMLHPVLRVVNLVDAGVIRGVVQTDDGAGTFLPVADAMVFLMPFGETDLDLSIAVTASETDGSYAFLGVDANTFDLIATTNSLSGGVEAVVVLAGQTTTADIFVE